jgi:hypothetical protein
MRESSTSAGRSVAALGRARMSQPRHCNRWSQRERGMAKMRATRFPPPLWGRDRERGGVTHRARDCFCRLKDTSTAAVLSIVVPLPHKAGVSHMGILESQPSLGAAHRLGVQMATRNRIENRTESDRERSVGAFDAVSSNPHGARQDFPYAIPLPHKGGGNAVARLVTSSTLCSRSN